MLYPKKEELKDLLKSYKTVPVFHELLIDSCTPVRIFSILKAECKNCFILESVDNSDQWGRYSFIGINPKTEIRIKNRMAKLLQMGKPSCSCPNPIAFQ